MRLRTVSSIILPSAHKVKASARNSVTTVVGGREMLRGTLERVPRTPPELFSNFLLAGVEWRCRKGACPRRGVCPCAALVRPAAVVPCRGACFLCRLLTLPLWCLVGGRGGFGRPPALPLAFFPAPIPPPALAERSSRREGGEYYFISPGAIAPGTPGIKPLAALTEPAK